MTETLPTVSLFGKSVAAWSVSFSDFVSPGTRMMATIRGVEYSAQSTKGGMEIYGCPRWPEFYDYPPKKVEVGVRIGKETARFEAYQTGFSESLPSGATKAEFVFTGAPVS